VNDPRLVDLQRQRWVPDQMLRSRDLRDQQATSDQLRWWHNRAVHEAFGIASGFEVALSDDQTSVTVAAGVAHDCAGRLLRLLAPRDVSLPGDQRPSTLVARWRDPAYGAEPELVWLDTLRPGPREGVPLARLTFAGTTPTVTPVRARSRPLAGPRLGWGSTPADGTAWEPWLLGRTPIGVQVTVDTRAAGFSDVPCYFAWLQWPQVGSTQLDYWFYVLLALQYLEEPAIDRFVFRLLLPPSSQLLRTATDRPRLSELGRGSGDLVSLATGQRLYVCWLGIQDEGTGDGRHG
jgi:hypothetical protein